VSTELDVAIEAARAAGAILVAAHAKGSVRADHKGAVDLVTETDRACEASVREVLARHTPDIPVLGEEGGGAWEARTRWVVDPLDGTTNFVHGFPWFCVSVGLEVDGASEVGVVLDPIRDELFAARRGHGATRNGAPMRVSTVDRIDRALIATGFAYDRQTRARFYLARVEAVMEQCQGIRRAGAAALDLARVAAGQLDAYWEYGLQPWDIAAGRLLVTEAGGRVSGHDGSPPDRRLPSPLASNGALHEVMMSLLGSVDDRG
jgi:myo-inositol-1(or 4)-monophosphatase